MNSPGRKRSVSPQPGLLQYTFSHCQPCNCYTYLMRGAKGKYKASRKKGVVLALKCCRCKKMRAVVGCFVTTKTNGNNESSH